MGFIVWLGLFSLVFQIQAVDDWLIVPLTRVLAHLSNQFLTLAGFETHVAGTILQGAGGFAVNIMKGCNGAYVMAIFAAAVLAYPVSWRLRLIGLAAGLPAVQVINLARIISLYWIGVERPDLFEKFHYQVWQTVVILLSMVLWLAWAELSNRAARR